MKKDQLKEYRKKRDFRKTPEPSGKTRRKGAEPLFVIQKHDARNLHYDFRLEANGVLKSWAVPKGPSTNPREKRLAIPTEDHPLEYATFEGVIPVGEYGAGTVLLWDTGTYRNLKQKNGKEVPVGRCIKDGHVLVKLNGKKLKGGYSLIRTGKGKEERWLLVKMADDEADARRNPIRTEPKSVITGRTIEEIAEERS